MCVEGVVLSTLSSCCSTKSRKTQINTQGQPWLEHDQQELSTEKRRFLITYTSDFVLSPMFCYPLVN